MEQHRTQEHHAEGADRTATIRQLNDRLRRHRLGGKIMLTAGIAALVDEQVAAVLEAVGTFEDFSPDNDPYSEHDFGAVDIAGHCIFWKIDYYDPTLTCHSPDPANPSQTCRVLTVMLAEEY